MKKEKKFTQVKEKSVRSGNIVEIISENVILRSYIFSDPYTAQMFCRMTNRKGR